MSTAEGCSLVRLGNTALVCGVKAVSHFSYIYIYIYIYIYVSQKDENH